MATTASSRARATRAARTSGTSSSSKSSSSSSSSSSSTAGQVGLNQNQVSQLRGMSGIDQKALSAYEASGSAVGGSNNPNGRGRENITSQSLQDRGQINLPAQKTTVVGDIAANNVGFTGTDSSLTSTGNLLTQKPQEVDKYAGATSIYDKYVQDITKAADERTTGAEIQRQLEKDTKIKKLRQTENDLSAQINTIIANRDANVLRVEGQGRGIPEAIIGGQQAQINKEAAIQALPIQALLAQAQGNVALAEAHINTWGSILMNDANNEYNQRKELLTSAKDFAIGIESKRIDDLDKANERKYQETQALITAKTQAMSQALGQGAPSSVSTAIQAATTPEQVVQALGKYNGDLLAQEAQRANIAQSWASVAASNTNRLLALAEAGDQEAIKKLKFDPRSIKEEVDPVTRRQLEGAIDSGTNLLRLAGKYKQIIDNYGYTNRTFGNTEVLGQISSLRALMTAEYKKAETLGTLDAGVLALMSQIVGEEPTSGLFTPLTNATGRRSDKLSSQIGTFIENITLAQARDKARLGIEPSVDFSVITEDDNLEINNLMGIQTTTNQQGGFNPNSFYK